MIYQNEDIVEASVTKSKPGDKIGLDLEEHFSKGGDKDNCRIYVTEIDGLFKKNDLDVRAGDELLEVNGILLTDKEQFPSGLKDVRRFLNGEWSIRVKVYRNADGGETSTTETETPDHSHSNLEPEDDSRHDRNGTGVGYAVMANNCEPLDAPVVPKKRRGQRKQRESLGALIGSIRHQTDGSGHARGTRKGKRREPRVPNDADSNHTRDSREEKEEKTATEEADSRHSRSTRKGKREPRVTDDTDSAHKRNRSKSRGLIRSRSNSKRVTWQTECRSKSDNKSHNKRSTWQTKSRSKSHCESAISNKKLTRENEDSESGHRRSIRKGKRESREIKNREKATNDTENESKIQGVQCTGSGVTLEMNDGNRVSVDPEEFMALVSEQNGRFVAISNRALEARPKLQRSKSGERRLAVPDSDEEKEEEKLEAPDVQTLQKRAEEREAMDVQTLQSLRNFVKKGLPSKEDTPRDAKNIPSLQELKNFMKNNKDHASLENILKYPRVRMSVTNLLEEEETSDSPTNMNMSQQPPPLTLSLRGMLGERLKKTNRKKWEESSMVSSTVGCMTNLIDPGDLMKIRNFADRPRLNGATVEVVCRSKGSYSNNRWDVSVIQQKHQSAGDAFCDPDRLVSVAAENLKHFV